jgi:hypothetical protein
MGGRSFLYKSNRKLESKEINDRVLSTMKLAKTNTLFFIFRTKLVVKQNSNFRLRHNKPPPSTHKFLCAVFMMEMKLICSPNMVIVGISHSAGFISTESTEYIKMKFAARGWTRTISTESTEYIKMKFAARGWTRTISTESTEYIKMEFAARGWTRTLNLRI